MAVVMDAGRDSPRQKDGDGAQQQHHRAGDVGLPPRGAEHAEDGRPQRRAQRERGGVDAHDEPPPIGRREGVDPEFGDREQDAQRRAEGEAQREPHDEGRRRLEPHEARGGEHDGPHQQRPQPKLAHQQRHERRGEDGGDAGDRRVDADPLAGHAARFQLQRQKGNRQADADPHHRDGGDGGRDGGRPAHVAEGPVGCMHRVRLQSRRVRTKRPRTMA